MSFPFKVCLTEKYLKKVVLDALREDLGKGDLTTELTVEAGTAVEARLRLKDRGVIAGLPVVQAVFRCFDPSCRVLLVAEDGRSYGPGRLLARIRGKARSVLSCERVALNFVQRLSGIATVTRRFVEEVKGTRCRIVDTRKTTPGLRLLEKYAVLAGGGHNHRLSLSDLALIKDNHIKAAGGIRQAVERVRKAEPGVMVEIEISPELGLAGLDSLDVDMVMLDNWPLRRLPKAIRTIRDLPCSPLVEVSGKVSLRNVRRIAQCGPDFISVGYLTHSAPSLDISLDF